MCLRVHNACGGLYNTARRWNSSLCSHRFWRNPYIFRFSHRHRLQIPLQRIIPGIVVVSVYLPSIPALYTLHHTLYTNNYVSQVNTKPTPRLSHHRPPLYPWPLLLWHPRTRRLRNITILLSYSCHHVTKIQTTASSRPKRSPYLSWGLPSPIGAPTKLVGSWGERRHMSPNDAMRQSSRPCSRTRRHSYPPWHPSRTLYWLHPRIC